MELTKSKDPGEKKFYAEKVFDSSYFYARDLARRQRWATFVFDGEVYRSYTTPRESLKVA